MKHQVAGFMVSAARQKVLLIQKNRPEWMKGHLNAIGGSIEKGELPLEAMVREFAEETGLATLPSEWRLFLELFTDHDTHVSFFVCFVSEDEIQRARSITDEPLALVELDSLDRATTLPGIRWQLRMALSWDYGEDCKHFSVVEVPRP